MDGTGPVIDIGCDSTTGSDEDQFGESFLELDLGVLPNPLCGHLEDLDLGVCIDLDSDVVSALHLEDHDIGVAELVVGHQGTDGGPAVLHHG